MMCAEKSSLLMSAAAFTWSDGNRFPSMIELPAGEFVMGENEGDKFANDTERPAHRVKIASAFALGKFPVTIGEFRKFRSEHLIEDAEELPVVRVSWEDATAYCKWLSETSGRAYRLPSEAEWEFACRADSRGPFAGGDELSTDEANFLYDENGTRVGMGRRTTVGDFPPNNFGLYDMHGNVCEWVADSWHPDYLGAPVDGSARTSEDSRRVIRGGAWDYLPRLLRSSWRDWRLANQRADTIGFRVATNDLKQFARA
jgi:formylglycine-generating enzyme required for sulfatase activity